MKPENEEICTDIISILVKIDEESARDIIRAITQRFMTNFPVPKRFTPPTAEEVGEYCAANGYSLDPLKFVSFYQSKGWKVGKTPMKDWKAAVRTWTRPVNSTPNFHPDVLRLFKAYRVTRGIADNDEGRAWNAQNGVGYQKAAETILRAFLGDVVMAGRYIIVKGMDFNALGFHWTLHTIARHAMDEKTNKIGEQKNGHTQKPLDFDSAPDQRGNNVAPPRREIRP